MKVSNRIIAACVALVMASAYGALAVLRNDMYSTIPVGDSWSWLGEERSWLYPEFPLGPQDSSVWQFVRHPPSGYTSIHFNGRGRYIVCEVSGDGALEICSKSGSLDQ